MANATRELGLGRAAVSTTLLAAEEASGTAQISSPERGGALASTKPARPYCGGQEPLFLAALAFSAGILAANYLWRSPYVWLTGFMVAIAAAVAERASAAATAIEKIANIIPVSASGCGP